MTIKRRLIRAVGNLPLAQHLEKTLKRVHMALLAFVILTVVLILCLLIISAYFLLELIEKFT